MRIEDLIKLPILIAVGIYRDQKVRRRVMMGMLLIACAMLFTGSVLIGGWLGEHIVAFLLYWLLCAWFTGAACLLAVYDILMVRKSARQQKKHLREKIFGPTK